MDTELSPFRISVKLAFTEIATSVPVFWVIYLLGFGGKGALMISLAAMYAVRLWKKGFFGGQAVPPSDAHIPVISPGHALSWMQIFGLAGLAAALDGADVDRVIRGTIRWAAVLALLLAGHYAWLLYRSRKEKSSKG